MSAIRHVTRIVYLNYNKNKQTKNLFIQDVIVSTGTLQRFCMFMTFKRKGYTFRGGNSVRNVLHPF